VRPARLATRCTRQRRAFTLVELMVSSGMASIVLAAILSAALFIARSSINLADYSDMETQTRNAMETFAQDVRMSGGLSWDSANSLTLRLGTATGPAVTYVHDPVARTFSRVVGRTTDVLITQISAFSFTAYNITTAAVPLSDLTAAAAVTKQVQISLETERRRSTLALTTNKVISARFVLRNKSVTA